MSFMKYATGGILEGMAVDKLTSPAAPPPIPPPAAPAPPVNTVTASGTKAAIVPDLPKATDTTPKTETLGAA